jgi:hypothetical protein
MEHLQAIEDWAVRDAVATVQARFEDMLMELLPQNGRRAHDYLVEAQRRITGGIKNRAEVETLDQRAQHASETLALAILDKSFERLLAALGWQLLQQQIKPELRADGDGGDCDQACGGGDKSSLRLNEAAYVAFESGRVVVFIENETNETTLATPARNGLQFWEFPWLDQRGAARQQARRTRRSGDRWQCRRCYSEEAKKVTASHRSRSIDRFG